MGKGQGEGERDPAAQPEQARTAQALPSSPWGAAELGGLVAATPRAQTPDLQAANRPNASKSWTLIQTLTRPWLKDAEKSCRSQLKAHNVSSTLRWIHDRFLLSIAMSSLPPSPQNICRHLSCLLLYFHFQFLLCNHINFFKSCFFFLSCLGFNIFMLKVWQRICWDPVVTQSDFSCFS